MHMFKRVLMVVSVAATTALLTGLAAGAFGAEGKEHHGNSPHNGTRHGVPLIEESLAPSQPTDPTFHGVKPGSVAVGVEVRRCTAEERRSSRSSREGPRHPIARHAGSCNGDQRGAVLRG